MRRELSLRFLFLLALAVVLWAPQGLAQGNYVVTVLTDRPEALYHVGETVTFDIKVAIDDRPITEGQATYVLSNDGSNALGNGMLTLTADPAKVTGTLDHPGFLRCVVEYSAPDAKAYEGIGGAGFDPLDIKPSMPVPDDFDAFWAEKRAQLAQVPMNPVLTEVESHVKGVRCFDVQIACLGGKPVSGYLARPTDAQPKSLPAVLRTHGAGVGSSNPQEEIAALGMLALDINAHGIPNGQSAEFYKELENGTLKNYRYEGRESRETYYFLGMYLRLMRAMEFLTAQPEWDGKFLIARGSSQGGGQSIVAAGLDSRVTALIANVPAMCDHTGVINGWPRLVPRDAAGNPDPQVLQASRYFDAMNFATRIKADALVSVGFIDDTCRPTTVYAAYNNLAGKKRIVNKPLMKHAVPPEWEELSLDMIKRHILRSKGQTTN